MTGNNFGQVKYPGAISIESCSITDMQGIQPSVAVLEIYPQEQWPDLYGDLVFTYNGNTITFPNCIVDSVLFTRGGGGKIARVRILDERWRWQYGQITGKYNIRLPNDFVDPAHERTPRQLAALLFEAMGVTNYDASDLPDDARPYCDWEGANPAQSLAKMCDELGCRIVPQRSARIYRICQAGFGEDLPENYPYQDAGSGIDPKELPDYIQVLTAPIEVQTALYLEPVGRDIDQSWNFVQNLSYCPNPADYGSPGYSIGFGFGRIFPSMDGGAPSGTPPFETYPKPSPVRILQEDGTAISPREFAQDTVYRCYRINTSYETNDTRTNDNGQVEIWIPGIKLWVTRKQIILTDHLSQCYTDYLGAIHQRPAYAMGSFENKKSNLNGSKNYPKQTRIDFQGKRSGIDPEERSSCNLCPDPLDTDRSIIVFSNPMKQIVTDSNNPNTDGSYPNSYEFSDLWYVSSIQIRDPDTWQPIRYARVFDMGNNGDPTNVLTVVKEDIQPWIVNLYDENIYPVKAEDNIDDVNNQCDYYIESIKLGLLGVATTTRTYIGLYPIDMDGNIQQVSYKVGKSGCDTVASTGTEHDFWLPSYSERRQADGRRNIYSRMDLIREIDTRRQATKGTFNTI